MPETLTHEDHSTPKKGKWLDDNFSNNIGRMGCIRQPINMPATKKESAAARALLLVPNGLPAQMPVNLRKSYLEGVEVFNSKIHAHHT